MPALVVKKAVVKRDRIVLSVEVSEGYPARTTPDMARILVRHVPTLPLHTCKNEVGETFGDVIADTSLPHAFEHVAVDAMAHANPRGSFVGTTQWDTPGRTAHVELSYEDDIEALSAVQWALNVVNEAVEEAATHAGQRRAVRDGACCAERVEANAKERAAKTRSARGVQEGMKR